MIALVWLKFYFWILTNKNRWVGQLIIDRVSTFRFLLFYFFLWRIDEKLDFSTRRYLFIFLIWIKFFEVNLPWGKRKLIEYQFMMTMEKVDNMIALWIINRLKFLKNFLIMMKFVSIDGRWLSNKEEIGRK